MVRTTFYNHCTAELIEQTANDYDMPYSEVEWIYKKWNDKGLFYEKLEEYIKDRDE